MQDERLQEHKGYAAIAFARANGVDRLVIDHPGARFGIVASGKAFEDVRQALAELGLGPQEQAAVGLRLYKVRMPWPLEPEGIRAFSRGLEEVLIVEERREIIENQIKQELFNWRADVRPRIVGKFDEADRPFLHLSAGLTVASVAGAIAARLLRLDLPPDLAARLRAATERLNRAEQRGADHVPPVLRVPHFCAGCPHNTSTRVPEGQRPWRGSAVTTWRSGWGGTPKPSPAWGPRACPGRPSAASPMKSTALSIWATAPSFIRGIWRSASPSPRG
ncbi:hypothetical protein ACFSHQ_26575 [Gemmobacter lanyuensis]